MSTALAYILILIMIVAGQLVWTLLMRTFPCYPKLLAALQDYKDERHVVKSWAS